MILARVGGSVHGGGMGGHGGHGFRAVATVSTAVMSGAFLAARPTDMVPMTNQDVGGARAITAGVCY